MTSHDRWKLIVEAALDKAITDKKGAYLINQIKDLRKKPFIQIHHETPEVFDWLLL